MSAHEPDWTNWNEHDPGITLVALFAFLAASFLWQSSNARERAGSRLPRAIGAGLGVASAVVLLRQCYRKKRNPGQSDA